MARLPTNWYVVVTSDELTVARTCAVVLSCHRDRQDQSQSGKTVALPMGGCRYREHEAATDFATSARKGLDASQFVRRVLRAARTLPQCTSMEDCGIHGRKLNVEYRGNRWHSESGTRWYSGSTSSKASETVLQAVPHNVHVETRLRHSLRYITWEEFKLTSSHYLLFKRRVSQLFGVFLAVSTHNDSYKLVLWVSSRASVFFKDVAILPLFLTASFALRTCSCITTGV